MFLAFYSMYIVFIGCISLYFTSFHSIVQLLGVAASALMCVVVQSDCTYETVQSLGFMAN